jgi:hypothetical protein
LKPVASVRARFRVLRACRELAFFLGITAFASSAAAGERLVSFDLPAQPLAAALVQFADLTGMAVLMDEEWGHGLQSSPVKGRLPGPEALRILLAGTGLSIRFAGTGAATVVRGDAGEDAARRQSQAQAVYGFYFAAVQNRLIGALCENQDTRSGDYRAALQIWIDAGGAVQASHLLGSTGDVVRDDEIAGVIATARLAPPPQGLPQPLTLVLRQTPAKADECAPRAAQHQ